MELFRNRPFCVFCLCGLAALGLCVLLPSPAFVFLTVSAGAGAAVCAALLLAGRNRLRKKEEREKKLFPAFFCFFFALVFSLSYFAGVVLPNKRAEEVVGEERKIVLSIVEPVASNGKTVTYSARFHSVDGKKYRAKTALTAPADFPLRPGSTVGIVGEIVSAGSRPFSPASRVDGALTECTVKSGTYPAFADDGTTPASFFATLRRRLCLLLDDAYGEDSGLLRALLLGDKSALSAGMNADFRRAGVSHLLAVSGLHVSALIGALEWALRKSRMPKKGRIVLLSFFALLLLILNGFTPSACRAVGMLLLTFLGFLTTRETDAVSSLFASVSLLLLLSPRSVGDVGLWLSALATLGILTLYGEFDDRLRAADLPKGKASSVRGRLSHLLRLARRRVISRAALSLFCVFFTAFLLSLCFGELSLVGVPAGLLLAPLCLALLILSPVLLPLALLTEFAAAPIGFLCGAIGRICAFFAEIPGGYLPIGQPFPRAVLGVMSAGLIAFLLLPLPKRKRPYSLLLPAGAAVLIAGFFVFRAIFPGAMTVTPIESASGDLYVLRRGNATVVADASAGGSTLRYRASEAIRQSGGDGVTLYVLTGFGPKTAATVSAFCERSFVREAAVPAPVTETERAFFLDLLAVCERERIDLTVYDRQTASEVASRGAVTVSVIPSEDGFSVRVSDGKTALTVDRTD